MRRRRALVALALLVRGAGQAAGAPVEMSLGELVAGLEAEIAAIDLSPAVRKDFARLAEQHGLADDTRILDDFMKVKVVFEAVREAGWWGIAWDVTDREPRSDAIWRAWQRLDGEVPAVTAIAECDESAALAAFLLRKLGVRSVGLLWPYPNHTVAVWKVRRRGLPEARVVLPTSQVFLQPDDGLGTAAFDLRRQATVHDYTRADAAGPIPRRLGEAFLGQVKRYAAASDRVQRRLRILRARLMARETPASVERDRAALQRELEASGAPAQDTAAVAAFAAELRVRDRPSEPAASRRDGG